MAILPIALTLYFGAGIVSPVNYAASTGLMSIVNFRLDMSRLHAEWLVEQKSTSLLSERSVCSLALLAEPNAESAEYEEALTWDQLKIAMKDSDTSPFPGFEEGLINFPPTFKYDVWKSARATNREIRRSLRRRGSVKDSGPPDLSKTVGSTLGHVPESGAEDMEEDDLVTAGRMSEDDQPRRSMESSRSSRSVSRGTEAGDDASDDLDELQGRGNAAKLNGLANSHRPLDVKIKEKTKKMFGLVKLKTALTPSPGRKAFGKDGKDRRDRATESSKPSLDGRGLPPPPQLHSFTVIRKSTAASGETDFDAQSRRTSLSSLASMREAQPHTAAVVDIQGDPADSSRVSNFGDMPHNVRTSDTAMPIPSTPTHQTVPDPMLSMSTSGAAAGGGRLRRPTIGSQAQASPPRAGRSFSLKRTMSGRSAKLGTSLGSSAVFDEAEDNREGVYDSSKKQRVPSWVGHVRMETRNKRGSADVGSAIGYCGKHIPSQIPSPSQKLHLQRKLTSRRSQTIQKNQNRSSASLPPCTHSAGTFVPSPAGHSRCLQRILAYRGSAVQTSSTESRLPSLPPVSNEMEGDH